MPGGDIVADDAWPIIGYVANAIVLNVSVVADCDPLDVPANYGSEPDAGIFTDLHIANDSCRFGNEHIFAEKRVLPEIR